MLNWQESVKTVLEATKKWNLQACVIDLELKIKKRAQYISCGLDKRIAQNEHSTLARQWYSGADLDSISISISISIKKPTSISISISIKI